MKERASYKMSDCFERKKKAKINNDEDVHQITEKRVWKDYIGLKKTAMRYYVRGKFNRALGTTFLAAGFMYTLNQTYMDNQLESLLHRIGKKICGYSSHKKNKRQIIFFDGFGNDSRGLAYIYIKSLCELQYDIKYITYRKYDKTISRIQELLPNSCIYYLDELSWTQQIEALFQLVEGCDAEKTMLYIPPDDVAAIAVFSQYKEKMQRYLINITDHAFWLGRNAADYFIEFRNYGANVTSEYRKISRDRIVLQPFYPQILDVPYEGLPFELGERRMILSGGSLYKTFDSHNTYYNLVDAILNHADDTVFYYIGDGDTSELKRLALKYKDRVFYSRERVDFFSVMKEAYIYLSTYPLFGGLMTQYAIAADKLPITLANETVVGEQTVNTGKDAWCFTNENVLIQEVIRLLNDKEHLTEQEKKISYGNVEEKEFCANLDLILEHGKSKQSVEWNHVNKDRIQEHYLNKITKKEYYGLFSRKKCPHIVWKYPVMFTKGLLCNLIKV